MSVTYDDLVAAATIGIGQRPITVTDLAGPAGAHAGVLDADPAAAVLDAAVLLDAARRAAGLTPAPADLPVAAPADPAPELSPVAGAILRDVLLRGDRELAAQLLWAAADAGRRAPAPDLPVLLDTAVPDAALRTPVAAVLGERGRWLAAYRPEWLRVADERAMKADDPLVWETGRLPERVAWLTEQRRADPSTARDLLVAGWVRETGDDRVQLLEVLRTGLSEADERFLEAALDDRKGEVRRLAARLLAALPGSAFSGRAAARAEGVLRIERRGGLPRRLVVILPEPPDAAAQRDGLRASSPYKAIGDRAWHLLQVVAAAPLGFWSAELGSDPTTLAELEIDGDFGAEVHAGWRSAARRERDRTWAQALLLGTRRGDYRAAFTPPDEQLLDLLPTEARVARAVELLREPRASAATATAVLACPTPWPAVLTDAVLAHVAAQLGSSEPAAPGALPQLIGRSVNLADGRDHAAALRELADRFRIRTAAVPGAGRWAAPLERAAGVLDLRRRFHQELQ